MDPLSFLIVGILTAAVSIGGTIYAFFNGYLEVPKPAAPEPPIIPVEVFWCCLGFLLAVVIGKIYSHFNLSFCWSNRRIETADNHIEATENRIMFGVELSVGQMSPINRPSRDHHSTASSSTAVADQNPCTTLGLHPHRR